MPASPWKTSMIDPVQLVHLVRGERREERLEPVEHRGQVESREWSCDSGIMEPGGKGFRPARSGKDRQEALAEEVLEVDGCEGGGGQVLGSVDAEGDVRMVARKRDGTHLADLDAGDPDGVAVLEPGGIAELGRSSRLRRGC